MDTGDYDDLKDEGPQDIDLEQLGDQEDSETVPCPACGAEVYKDADRCPVCGQYVVTRAEGRPSQWKWVMVALMILAIAIWLATC